MKLIGKVSEIIRKGASIFVVDLSANKELYPKSPRVLRLYMDPPKVDALVEAGAMTLKLTVTSSHDIGPALMVHADCTHPDMSPKIPGDQTFFLPLSSPPTIGEVIDVDVTF